MIRKSFLLLLAGGWAGMAAAEPAADADRLGWKSAIEFGFVDTSGNSQTTSTNGKFSGVYELPSWRNKFQVEYLKASDEGGTTARRTVAQLSTNFKLDESRYLFGNVRYESDAFSAFDYRLSETVGYGRRFRWDGQRLDLEAGVGGSHTRPLEGERDNEAIARLAGMYVWQFNPTGELSETAFSEMGSNNTHSESETALKLRINGHLATKLSYRVLFNSEVPEGTQQLDTITAVTLVYDF